MRTWTLFHPQEFNNAFDNETDANKEVGTFDDFFAEAINEGSADTPDKNEGADNEVVDEHDDNATATTDTSEAPTNADSQAPSNGRGDADYRTLYEQERQRTKSWKVA